MIQRKGMFFFGIFIFLIPFLGLPSFWKTLLVVFSGLVVIYTSVKITLPKKIIKPTTKRRMKKEKITSVPLDDVLVPLETNDFVPPRKSRISKMPEIE